MRIFLTCLCFGLVLAVLPPQGGAQAKERKTIKIKRAYPYSPPTTVVFADGGGIVDEKGNALSEIDATTSVSSHWINKSNRVVVLMFDDENIIGRRSVRLNHGDDLTVLWRGRSWPTKPSMTIICKHDEEEGETEDIVMRVKVIGPPPKGNSAGSTGGG